MSKVAIIGGGAAGMLCGVYAARRGHQVHILEKMRNSEKSFSSPERDDATSPMIPIPKNFFGSDVKPQISLQCFLHLWKQRCDGIFEEAGVPLKTERGNRVFPVSDHSSDIIRALERELKKPECRSIFIQR